MSLPVFFTTPNPYSKVISMVLLVTFPIIGLFIGMELQRKITPEALALIIEAGQVKTDDEANSTTNTLCKTEDLSITGKFSKIEKERVINTIEVTNTSPIKCILNKYPQITEIKDVKGSDLSTIKIVFANEENKNDLIFIEPEEKMTADLTWTNWCGVKPKGELIAITQIYIDKVNVVLKKADNQTASASPICDVLQQESVMIIDPFTKVHE